MPSMNPFVCSSGDMHDYSHASKVFRDNGYELHPKYGFLYFVRFIFNPEFDSTEWDAEKKLNTGLMVKQIDLPKFSVDTRTLNAYNRTNLVQTKIKYEPINVRFHDDAANVIRTFWNFYSMFYYRDSDYTASLYNQAHKYDPRQTDAWGFTPGWSPDTAKLSPTTQLITQIQIYSLFQKKYIGHFLHNPIITTFRHGNHASNATELMEVEMSVSYEAVTTETGNVTKDNFSDMLIKYDNNPSRLLPVDFEGNLSSDLILDRNGKLIKPSSLPKVPDFKKKNEEIEERRKEKYKEYKDFDFDKGSKPDLRKMLERKEYIKGLSVSANFTIGKTFNGITKRGEVKVPKFASESIRQDLGTEVNHYAVAPLAEPFDENKRDFGITSNGEPIVVPMTGSLYPPGFEKVAPFPQQGDYSTDMTGVSANIKGTVPNVGSLPEEAQVGDAYVVESSREVYSFSGYIGGRAYGSPDSVVDGYENIGTIETGDDDTFGIDLVPTTPIQQAQNRGGFVMPTVTQAINMASEATRIVNRVKYFIQRPKEYWKSDIIRYGLEGISSWSNVLAQDTQGATPTLAGSVSSVGQINRTASMIRNLGDKPFDYWRSVIFTEGTRTASVMSTEDSLRTIATNEQSTPIDYIEIGE